MEARETDKLFRDKLKSMTSSPSPESWERLEAMLEEKKAPVWFTYRKVAAIGLLLLASIGVLMVWKQDNTPVEVAEVKISTSESLPKGNTIVPHEEVSDADTQKTTGSIPKESQEKPSSVAPVAAPEKKARTAKKTVRQPEKEKSQIKEPKVIEEPAEQSVAPKIVIEEVQVAQLDVVDEPDLTQRPKKKKLKSVRITYKSGNTKVARPDDDMIAIQKTDTTGGNKIKNFLAQTREFEPGDLWADIRDAKDNLFQRKNNSKKNNVKNLNK